MSLDTTERLARPKLAGHVGKPIDEILIVPGQPEACGEELMPTPIAVFLLLYAGFDHSRFSPSKSRRPEVSDQAVVRLRRRFPPSRSRIS